MEDVPEASKLCNMIKYDVLCVELMIHLFASYVLQQYAPPHIYETQTKINPAPMMVQATDVMFITEHSFSF